MHVESPITDRLSVIFERINLAHFLSFGIIKRVKILKTRIILDLYGVCSFDDKQDRILSDYFEASDDMTIEKCLSICRSHGYPYSGLEWSCECHCGHAPDDGFEWAWSDKCDDRCAGDSNQICGGSEAMSVWKTPPSELNGYCVNDYPRNRRVLNDFSITGLKDLTIENCRIICKGKNLWPKGFGSVWGF